MTTQIQRKFKELFVDVMREQYYVEDFERCLQLNGMDVEGVAIDEYDDAKLVSMANDFWFELPDGPQIRTSTFFKLCEIAEQQVE